MVTATSGASAESPNPYQSPEMAMLKAKLKRLPAFLTGVIGLAIGAGFYGVLCGLAVASYARSEYAWVAGTNLYDRRSRLSRHSIGPVDCALP